MKNINLAVTQVLRFGSKRKVVKLIINSNVIPYKLYWVKVCCTSIRHKSIRVYVQFQLTLYNGIWVELFHHRKITFMYHLLSAVLDITLAGIIRNILSGKCETSCSTLLILPTFIYGKTLYAVREQQFVQTVRVNKKCWPFKGKFFQDVYIYIYYPYYTEMLTKYNKLLWTGLTNLTLLLC